MTFKESELAFLQHQGWTLISPSQIENPDGVTIRFHDDHVEIKFNNHYYNYEKLSESENFESFYTQNIQSLLYLLEFCYKEDIKYYKKKDDASIVLALKYDVIGTIHSRFSFLIFNAAKWGMEDEGRFVKLIFPHGYDDLSGSDYLEMLILLKQVALEVCKDDLDDVFDSLTYQKGYEFIQICDRSFVFEIT